MPIDSNIYFQQQSPDIMGNVQKGLSMRDMLDQKKKQQGIDAAYQAGMMKNPDGSVSFDGNKTMSAMSGVQGAGREAAEFAQQQRQMSAAEAKAKQEKQMRDIDLIARVAPEIKDQQSYEGGIAHLSKMGVDVSQMPRAYDPGLVNRYGSMAMSYKDKMDQQNKDRDFSLKEQELGLKEKEIAQKEGKTSGALEGRKTLDKEFAKDYNDWTSGGAKRSREEIKKIEGVISRLEQGKGTTGGLTGMFGDRITSDDVLKNRADVQQSAMSLIKTLLSGATSDTDREQIVNTLWNESDSTENNLDRIRRFATDMKSRADDTDAKSRYYEQNQSLAGYQGISGKNANSESQTIAQTKPRVFKTNEIEWK